MFASNLLYFQFWIQSAFYYTAAKKLCQIAKESGHAPLQMDRSRLQMTCAEAALCHYCKEYTRVEESAQKVKLNRCQK